MYVYNALDVLSNIVLFEGYALAIPMHCQECLSKRQSDVEKRQCLNLMEQMTCHGVCAEMAKLKDVSSCVNMLNS